MVLLLRHTFIIIGLSLLTLSASRAQHSIAEQWNEACLLAISRDFARPTVHARNLYHHSIAMYDAWAAYDASAERFLLGKTRGSYTSVFNGVDIPSSSEAIEVAREEAISFAVFRLLRHRFMTSPGAGLTIPDLNNRMDALGYDRSNTSTDYINGGPAELGNYIAQQIINYGFTDGSNESANYGNLQYTPLNPNILPEQPGTGGIVDPNRWQAISLSVAIDQSGNVVSDPPHLSPEWGNVVPFSLNESNKSVLQRDGSNWNVFYDPGFPALIDTTDDSGFESLWKWNFCMVSIWQSHLDPNDPSIIDISPLSQGNISSYPLQFEDYSSFYNFLEGGTTSPGHTINPVTNQPYEPQFVKRGDYSRVVAEYWADGPSSTTPPGHWYEIYNEIRHHPLWENKWQGEGEILSQLEYDVKAYLTLGGAMHDAAITAWSIKGYYDFVRPVSAVRYMCEKGQCSDPNAMSYHPAGMPLLAGHIELVLEGDALAGPNNENVGKIKLYTWKGPDYIDDPETDYAGVGWILGEEWWPYQRPTFVTPPFAGYISGHSTFSRTAAEVLTNMTGSAFFPGGMSNFEAPQNEFLEFEIGPSETLYMQWATYQDASDQCSLSRIWGGIHPPIDDIPGRLIGMELGPQAFNYANSIFDIDRPGVVSIAMTQTSINIDDIGTEFSALITFSRDMDTSTPPGISFIGQDPLLLSAISVTSVEWLNSTQYSIVYEVEESEIELYNIAMRIAGSKDSEGLAQNVYLQTSPFIIDTKRPEIENIIFNTALLNDGNAQGDGLVLTLNVSEASDTGLTPNISFNASANLDGVLIFNPNNSQWINSGQYQAHFDLVDTDLEVDNIQIEVSNIEDLAGNALQLFDAPEVFAIDTRNPLIAEISASSDLLNISDIGGSAITIVVEFDEDLNTAFTPSFTFPNDNPLPQALVFNPAASTWLDDRTYSLTYNLSQVSIELDNIVLQASNVFDLAGNPGTGETIPPLFSIDTKRPEVTSLSPQGITLADADAEDGIFEVTLNFSEAMSTNQQVLLQLSGPDGIAPSLMYNPFSSSWIDEDSFNAVFNFSDQNATLENINLQVSFGADLAGNLQTPYQLQDWIDVDTENPDVLVLFANTYSIGNGNVGEGEFSILALFSEAMDTNQAPHLNFNAQNDPSSVLAINPSLSEWENAYTFHAYFDVLPQQTTIPSVGVLLSDAFDLAGNDLNANPWPDFFSIDLDVLNTAGGLADYGLEMYPNPLRAGQALNLAVAKGLSNPVLRIYSQSGQLVEESLLPAMNAGVHNITPRHLSAGIYLAEISSKEGRALFKLARVD